MITKTLVFLVLCVVYSQAELSARFLGSYLRRSPVESCPESSCIRQSHDDAKKCIMSVYNSPGFKPCKRDRKFWLLSRLYGELSYLWHKSMERCWTADDYNRVDRTNDVIDVAEYETPVDENTLAFPPPCMAKVKREVAQCNKQLMKCPRYKQCFYRLDHVLALGYEKDAAERLGRVIKSCIKGAAAYAYMDMKNSPFMPCALI